MSKYRLLDGWYNDNNKEKVYHDDEDDDEDENDNDIQTKIHNKFYGLALFKMFACYIMILILFSFRNKLVNLSGFIPGLGDFLEVGKAKLLFSQ